MENINSDSQYLLYPYNGEIKIIEGKVITEKNGLTFKRNGVIVGSHFRSTEGKTYVKIPTDPLIYACRHLWCYGKDIDQGINIIKESLPKKDFFDDLRDKYTVEDFTGFIGQILGKDNGPTDLSNYPIPNSWDCIQDIYDIAAKYL